ncbi:hypothetical protein ADK54_30105 [Streptomyces sp. WM6378]|nr:hypothetical protein ADK54_30105 [Streptomyces sp. WM6378]
MTFLVQFRVPGESVTTYLFMDLRSTRTWLPKGSHNALIRQLSGRIPPFITTAPSTSMRWPRPCARMCDHGGHC